MVCAGRIGIGGSEGGGLDWDQLYALIIDYTGWPPSVIDNELTWPLYAKMRDQWAESPPAHVLLAARFGYKNNAKKGDLAELMAMFGGPGPIKGGN